MDLAFSRPINRLGGASVDAPWSLVDARMIPGDEVHALRRGSHSPVAPGWKPIRLWNGHPVGAGTFGSGLAGASAVPLDAIEHNAHLYVPYENTPGVPEDGGGIRVLPPDWDGTADWTNDPPALRTSILLNNVTVDVSGRGAVQSDLDALRPLWELAYGGRVFGEMAEAGTAVEGVPFCVAYQVIPYNERGEPGPAVRFSAFENTLGTYLALDGDPILFTPRHLPPPVEMRLPVTEACAYVDIYRTRHFASAGPSPGLPLPHWRNVADDGRRILNASRPDDAAFYFVERVAARGTGFGRYCEYVDLGQWISSAEAASMEILDSLPEDIEILGSVGVAGRLSLPGEPFDAEPILSSYRGGVSRLAFGRRAYKDGSRASSRVLYGDVTYPSQPPQPLAASWSLAAVVTGATVVNVAYVHEYKAGGETYYSEAVASPHALTKVWAGAASSALLVYVLDNVGTWHLYERITPSGRGDYRTSYRRDGELDAYPFAFDAGAYDASYRGTTGLPAATAWVRDPSLVSYSITNAPLAIEAGGFKVPDDRQVLALSGTDIAQDTATRTYPFFVATEQGFYLYQRNGEAFSADSVTSRYGIKVDDDGFPILATGAGRAFVATTDDRLMELRPGGSNGLIDIPVVEGGDPLYSSIHGIAYASALNEFYVLTDTGTYVWDVEREGFIASYSEAYSATDPLPDGKANLIWEQGGVVHLRVGFVGGATSTRRSLALDGSGAYRDGSVETQELTGGLKERLVELRVDYDRVPSATAIADAAVVHTVREGSPEASETFSAPPNVDRDIFRLLGAGHRIAVSGFRVLRSLYVR